MADKKSADILSLTDTDKDSTENYEVAGLAGLVKGKFTEAEDARKFDEERWLRAYRNYRESMVMIWLLLNLKNQKYLLK